MTHDRTDRTGLAAHEPRCYPSQPCRQAEQCARVQATVPAHGATTADYSLGRSHPFAACSHFHPCIRLKPVKLPEPVKPWPVGVIE